jgi:DNA-binding beta-propeller fold protein YncE
MGCGRPTGKPDLVWGKHGVRNAELHRPRAIAIDKNDRLYLVDYTARIQVYDLNGRYMGPTWQTPDYRNGRPAGLDIDRDGNLIVCDSHYHIVRIYSPDGQLLRTLGGESGSKPGQFGYISDCIQDEDGYFYISEFGDNDRITKLASDGSLVKCWGRAGTEPGEFQRLRALVNGPDKCIYAADAVNHRIQVFTRDGDFVRCIGEPGEDPGQLSYPYDLSIDSKGNLYVVEYNNHRVQKFSLEGKSLGCWGGPGREPGKLGSPWALAVDRRGRVHVVDTENHRVQRIRF